MPPRGLAFVWSPSRCAGAFGAVASCPGAQVPMALSFSFVACVYLPPGWPLLLFCSCSRAGLFWILRVLAPGLGRGAAVPVGLVGSRCAWWLLLPLASVCCLLLRAAWSVSLRSLCRLVVAVLSGGLPLLRLLSCALFLVRSSAFGAFPHGFLFPSVWWL